MSFGRRMSGVRRTGARASSVAYAEDVDLQMTHEAQQLRLPSQPADHEPQMRGVRRELSKRRIDRDPIAEQDLGPGVVIEFAVDVGKPRRDPRRYADSAC